jgi:hypothetical protein
MRRPDEEPGESRGTTKEKTLTAPNPAKAPECLQEKIRLLERHNFP